MISKIKFTRVFAAFLALQFLNVQIQSSFATEAMVKMSPGYESILNKIETKLEQKLENMSERRQIRFAERLFRLGIKGRNRITKMSDAKFEKRLKRMDVQDLEEEQITTADESLAADAAAVPEFSEITANLESHDQIKASGTLTKAAYLAHVDQELSQFGARVDENGKMHAPSHAEFQENFLKQNAQSSRAPAKNGFLRVLVTIFLAAAGLIFIGLAGMLAALIASPIIALVVVALITATVTVTIQSITKKITYVVPTSLNYRLS